MKKNIKDCTFIIPIKIDSFDRKRNCKIVLNYLLDNFDCNISVIEVGSNEVHECIDIHRITYRKMQLSQSEPFHKTKYLNSLAKNITTEVVCCYDIDVLLPEDTYIKSVDYILNKQFDVIYPYSVGYFQKKVFLPADVYRISCTDQLNDFNIENALSIYGHCNFASTEIYKNAGYENENFISYGPEDQEKLYRFTRLGYNVGRIDDVVYHLEHERGNDSTEYNPYYTANMALFENIKNMSDDEFNKYCRNLKYANSNPNRFE